jgi:hypothetical protein
MQEQKRGLSPITVSTPVPGLTEPAGNGTPAFTPILVDDLEDEGEIGLGDNPFAIG